MSLFGEYQSQAQYRSWEAFVRAVDAECIRRGRTFGVVRMSDLQPAYLDATPIVDFVEAQIARTDAAIAALANITPAEQLAAYAARLDADAAAGFTRD